MLLVIIGHLCKPYFATKTFYILTSPVKIPLFFAITGYIFKQRNGDVKIFFKKLFWGLALPWFILTLYPFEVVFYCVMRNWDKAISLTRSFFMGKIAWYMPCCMIAEIIFFFIRKYVKETRVQYGVMVIVAVAGYALSRLHIGNILSFNTAMIAQIFLLIGYAFKNEFESVDSDKMKKISVACAVIYIVMTVLTFILYNDNLDVNRNRYYNIPICIIVIWSGCLFVFLIGRYIRPWKWMCFIGRNTLVYYMLSSITAAVLVKISGMFGMGAPTTLVGGIVMSVGSCIVCAVIAVALNRFVPVVVGKGFRKNKETVK